MPVDFVLVFGNYHPFESTSAVNRGEQCGVVTASTVIILGGTGCVRTRGLCRLL